MRIRVYLIICLSFLFLNISAQEPFSNAMDTPPPSEDTWQQIEQLSQGPSLRAKPPTEPGDGSGQKLPLGNLGIFQYVILGLGAAYLTFKRNRKISKTNLQ